MRFLLDHNVPVSVGDVLRNHGHVVEFVSDILPTDSADPVVAATAELGDAILISLDADFDKIAPRIPFGHKSRFRKLSRISLKCNPVRASQRVALAMSFIELEWSIACLSADPRMIVWIGNDVLRTHR